MAARHASATAVRCRIRFCNAVKEGGLVVAAVLSGNRNFEGRINPQVRANYLASPPLVVAYAIAGNMDIDLIRNRWKDPNGKPVYLRDVWPTQAEVQQRDSIVDSRRHVPARPTKNRCKGTSVGRRRRSRRRIFQWDENSTYVKRPPFFENMPRQAPPVRRYSRSAGAGGSWRLRYNRSYFAGRLHSADSPAGKYLIANGVRRRISILTAPGAAITK